MIARFLSYSYHSNSMFSVLFVICLFLLTIVSYVIVCQIRFRTVFIVPAYCRASPRMQTLSFNTYTASNDASGD